MKKIILLSFCFGLITLTSSAQEKPVSKKSYFDSTGYHKLNFSFTWFELGGSIPIKEKKLRDLPYGMNSYLYNRKGSMAGGFFGLGFYYKNRLGISAIFTFDDYSVPDEDFKNYISTRYPNYYLPYAVQGHIYTLQEISYRLSYRFHKGQFTFEPQFQLGINGCDDFDTHFVLKEKGTNNFVEYDIKTENKKKNIFSYKLGLLTKWRYTRDDWGWNIEPGLKVDFLVVPTNFNYTITETPYNMPSTVNEVNVKRMRPAIVITLVASVFKK